MKILVSPLVLFTDTQTEIIKSFVYFALKLSKNNDITFVVTQKKKDKLLEKWGIKEKIKKNMNYILADKTITENHETGKINHELEYIEHTVGNDFDKIITMSHFMTAKNATKYFKDQFEEIYDNGYRIQKYSFGRRQIKQTYLFYYLNRKYNIPVYHYIVDWTEPDANELYLNKSVKISFYESKRHNTKHLPLYEDYLFRKQYNTIKKYNFVFGYSNLKSGKREGLSEKIDKSIKETNKVILYGKDEMLGIDKMISQKDYFEEIKKAKFSLIIPSIDTNEFSMMRFYDCIAFDCIPFIDIDCNTDTAFKGREDIIEFLEENNMFVDLRNNNINKIISELNYNKLIKEFKNLSSIRALYGRKYYRKLYKLF